MYVEDAPPEVNIIALVETLREEVAHSHSCVVVAEVSAEYRSIRNFRCRNHQSMAIGGIKVE